MASDETEFVAGERSARPLHQWVSPHAQLSNRIAMLIAGGIGAIVLGSYYWHVGHRISAVAAPRAGGVPSSGEQELPRPDFSQRLVSPGDVKPMSADVGSSVPMVAPAPAELEPLTASRPSSPVPPRPSIPDRRLSGSTFASSGSEVAPKRSIDSAAPTGAVDGKAEGLAPAAPGAPAVVSARILADQRLLLPKGAFIDCTLETAIDSSLPGLTTCVTATDTFGTDGKVVLLERGSKLTGETRGQVQQGMARIFVIWTEARTPTGVVVPLDSGGADELGRAGLTGSVDRHFWQRFGAALLISTIDAGTGAAIQASTRSGGTIIYNPMDTGQVATEALRGTLDIPPTVRKGNGDRVQVLVARDIDFRSVYEIRHASSGR